MRRSAAASGCARSSLLECAGLFGVPARGRAAGRGGARVRALLLARARRSAGHGRRRPAPRQADRAQGLRRVDRDPGGRCAAHAGLRACWPAPQAHADPAVRAELIAGLAQAAGAAGMVGGQCLDLEADKLGPARAAAGARPCRAPAGHEDGRAHPLCLRGRRHPRPRRRRSSAGRSRSTASGWGPPSRSPTTCSTPKARRPPWARRPARTPARPRSSRCWACPPPRRGSRRWRREALAALAPFGAARRHPARGGALRGATGEVTSPSPPSRRDTAGRRARPSDRRLGLGVEEVQPLRVDREAQLSCTLARTVGSTAATMVSSPTRTSSRISEPSRSTTSTSEGNVSPAGSASPATCRSSGRMPNVSCRPTWPRRRSAWAAGTSISKPGVLGRQAAVAVGHRHGGEIHRRRADEAGDEPVGRLVVELERLADLLHPAVAHDDDAVAQRHRLDLVVGDVDRGGAEPLVQLLELDAHLHAQFGVEVGQRLVEQEHPRMAHDGAAQRDALALAARELARLALQVVADAEDVGRLLDALGDLGAWRISAS